MSEMRLTLLLAATVTESLLPPGADYLVLQKMKETTGAVGKETAAHQMHTRTLNSLIQMPKRQHYCVLEDHAATASEKAVP